MDAGLDATVAGPWATQYTYYEDREPKIETRPDGTTIVRGYDPAGRPSTLSYPQGAATWAYNDAPGTPGVGHVASVTMSRSPYNFGDGQALSYGYDGPLLTSLTWTGAVGGSTGASVAFQYDPGFLLQSVAIDGASPVVFHYDADNLLAQVVAARSMSIARDPSNGLLTGTSIAGGGVSDTYLPDGNGRFAGYSASLGSAFTYSETVARYADNRIAQKTETIGGSGSGAVAETHFWQYSYDAPGRLVDVMRDGALVAQYGYDADDNRTTYTNAGNSATTAAYDGQDRLVRYGAATFTYGNNGELQSRSDATGTTAYTYDALGNLLVVGLSNGTTVQYVVDGENHRVGKFKNGALVVQYLYDEGNRVVAALAPGQAASQFVYGTKSHVPDLVVSGSTIYRVISDHLGSPRLLVNGASGAVAAQIDYDEFGNATVVSGAAVLPYLMPFGFAGGLYDADTGLVRFGVRDFDAVTGRWTRKDPIRLDGGMNLYAYSINDPVDLTDPLGTGPACVYQSGLCESLPASEQVAICQCRCAAGKTCNLEDNCGFRVTCQGGTCRADPPDAGSMTCAIAGEVEYEKCLNRCQVCAQ